MTKRSTSTIIAARAPVDNGALAKSKENRRKKNVHAMLEHDRDINYT